MEFGIDKKELTPTLVVSMPRRVTRDVTELTSFINWTRKTQADLLATQLTELPDG